MTLVATITKVSITGNGENPIFGESRIDIEMTDEAGGPFFLISSADMSSPLRIEIHELEVVVMEARKLISQYSKEDA